MIVVDNSVKATMIAAREEITAACSTAANAALVPDAYRPAVVVQGITNALIAALVSYSPEVSDNFAKLIKAELKKVPSLRTKEIALWGTEPTDHAGDTETVA